MSIELKGVDNLLKKLNQVSKISGKEAITKASETAVQEIRKEAQSFSKEEYQYIAKCQERNGDHYTFVDVGLKNDNVPFDKWQGLYFNNFGFQDKGLNFGDNGPYIDTHKLWFTDAVNQVEPKLKKEIRDKLKKEVKKEWNK